MKTQTLIDTRPDIDTYYLEMCKVVALIDIESVHPWLAQEIDAACATDWADGYFAWVISNVRPLKQPIEAIAKRKLYRL